MNPLPPLQFLIECSEKFLGDLELACLNRSQQCLKAAKIEWEEALAQREAAGVARWLIEHRPHLLEQARRTLEIERAQGVLAFPERALLSSSSAEPSDEGLCTYDITAFPATRKYSAR